MNKESNSIGKGDVYEIDALNSTLSIEVDSFEGDDIYFATKKTKKGVKSLCFIMTDDEIARAERNGRMRLISKG